MTCHGYGTHLHYTTPITYRIMKGPSVNTFSLRMLILLLIANGTFANAQPSKFKFRIHSFPCLSYATYDLSRLKFCLYFPKVLCLHFVVFPSFLPTHTMPTSSSSVMLFPPFTRKFYAS